MVNWIKVRLSKLPNRFLKLIKVNYLVKRLDFFFFKKN